VFASTGIGNNAACRNSALSEYPEKFLIPEVFFLFRLFNVCQGSGNALVSVVEIDVYVLTFSALQAILLLPYI